jgi:ABC-type transport system substrate-binding protein
MKKNWLWLPSLLLALLLVGACVPMPAAPGPAQPGEEAPTTAPQTLTIATGTDIENMNVHIVTASHSF